MRACTTYTSTLDDTVAQWHCALLCLLGNESHASLHVRDRKEGVHMLAGSRWSNKRVLDEDRPLGRGMRIKQEPAYIQDPSMVTGTLTLLNSIACVLHV